MAEQTWSEQVLDGVSRLPYKKFLPGSIVVYGRTAQPILSGSRARDVFLAAADLGHGRIMALAHEGYLAQFVGRHHHGDVAVARLHSNMKSWVSRGAVTDDSQIGIVTKEMTKAVALGHKILVWNGIECPENINTEDIIEFVLGGGGFVHAVCPWGWLQLRPGKAMADMPYYGVLRKVGLTYTTECVTIPPDGLPVVAILREGIRDVRLVQALEQVCRGEGLDRVCDTLDLWRYVPDVAELMTPAMTEKLRVLAEGCEAPSERKPVEAKASRAAMIICEMLTQTGACADGMKMPGVKDFPGDFDEDADLPAKQRIELEIRSDEEERHPTGYYAAAGSIVSVSVEGGEEAAGSRGWQLQIGSHTDDLSGCDSWQRWPRVVTQQPISAQQTTNVSTAFGGLVYVVSPAGSDARIRLTIEGVIEAPYFNLCDPRSVEDWAQRRHAPGLWADVAGECVVFTLPAESIRDIRDPSDVMRTWDRVVRLHNELRGRDARCERRQWIVADVQPSAGYMHSGYPVVTRLDVAQPTHRGPNDSFVLDDAELNQRGAWGLFHELGHNMQSGAWTFHGTVEVTCNIFTLHAMHVITGCPPLSHPWLKNSLEGAKTYLRGAKPFSQWQSDPGLALLIYAQLAHHFGWGAYKAVFRKYEAMPASSRPRADAQKIDTWFNIFSEIVGFNLMPIVDLWNIPVSQATRRHLAETLRPWLPDDQLTRLVPVIVRRLEGEYGAALCRQVGSEVSSQLEVKAQDATTTHRPIVSRMFTVHSCQPLQ